MQKYTIVKITFLTCVPLLYFKLKLLFSKQHKETHFFFITDVIGIFLPCDYVYKFSKANLSMSLSTSPALY